MARPKIEKDPEPIVMIGNYFTKPKDLEFISSGCEILNQVLGGGYPLGRICNIVGDKSTGKTLLAIEAMANFVEQYPTGNIWYAEAEAAFDKNYAAALGMPLKKVTFFEEGDSIRTVEQFYEALKAATEGSEGQPGLFILDSLDALSDAAELARGIEEGTFGASKPKKLSEIFRRLIQPIEDNKLCVLIISQVRDNIGVTFGEKHSRSGGKALDFYASQVLWLSQIKTLKKTINGVTRPIGVDIRSRCKKNKIGLPFRECDTRLRFGYGLDDTFSNLRWLNSVNQLSQFDETTTKVLNDKELKKYVDNNIEKLDDHDYFAARTRTIDLVKKVWPEIETKFLPTRRKY